MFGRIKPYSIISDLPKAWQVIVYILVGIAVGLALIVARIANAVSYLSDVPETCMNCHVMTDAYATWQRGSHSKAALCIDCHVPHSNIFAKLAFKATDGLKHSYVFTLRKEPQVLRLSDRAVPVMQANCQRCHSNQFEMIRLAESSERKCWDCHNNTHGSVRSLSSSPQSLRPQLPDAGLEWMKKGTKR
jgi:cytochrome c nitrite reductase small subunit